ncbi:tyrosyl-tRNA synthetase [Aspergillus sclerotialis]|uniref:Tyrosine--tRNA ligase n=1 Tax=Aspergillus sclerotialis TaxID=2070753 RepID=A0A3A2ZMZ4_9EURO|nr:tyrosyl-tRNA synthetase [Aspergillus sclerotialis]
MSPEERFSLIKENLQEVLNPDLIKNILVEGKNPRVYWVPAIKIAQLLAADCEVTVLIADLHAVLDSLKSTMEVVQYRAKYYQFMVTAMLQAVGVSTEKLRFVLGSSYQTGKDYCMDVYRLSTLVSEHDARKSAAEIVKQSANAPLSGLLYPILQVLDEQYLDVDVQFGGMDQRKLFAASTEWHPRLGYRKRAHLLNPIVPGLSGGKMSSSEADSKIDFLEPEESIRKKIRKAQAAPRETENNGLLAFVKYVLIPAAGLKEGNPGFRVSRDRDGLEPLVYTSIEPMLEDYKNDILTPQLLKPAVADAIVNLTAPIREAYAKSPEWQEITSKAYPPPEPPKPKKEKKQKQKTTTLPLQQKAPDNPETSGETANGATQ